MDRSARRPKLLLPTNKYINTDSKISAPMCGLNVSNTAPIVVSARFSFLNE
jgi:hypothetical protein